MSDDTESPLKFPCTFPIKAVGHARDDLDSIVLEIVRRHAPDVAEGAVNVRASSNEKYLSVTVTIEAQSRDQLDAIYQDLTASEHVLMSL